MPFLGREMGNEPDYSDEIAREIDDEIRRVIEEAHDTAHRVLREHMDELHQLSAILIERETIDKDQFERLLAGEAEESVFPEEFEPAPAPAEGEAERKPQPKPQPGPAPGRADAAARAGSQLAQDEHPLARTLIARRPLKGGPPPRGSSRSRPVVDSAGPARGQGEECDGAQGGRRAEDVHHHSAGRRDLDDCEHGGAEGHRADHERREQRDPAQVGAGLVQHGPPQLERPVGELGEREQRGRDERRRVSSASASKPTIAAYSAPSMTSAVGIATASRSTSPPVSTASASRVTSTFARAR